MFDYCPPEPRFHAFARVIVTNAGKVYIPTWLQGFRNKPLHLIGGVFFVSNSLLKIERQRELKKNNAILTSKPRSHVRILICRTLPITVFANRKSNFN